MSRVRGAYHSAAEFILGALGYGLCELAFRCDCRFGTGLAYDLGCRAYGRAGRHWEALGRPATFWGYSGAYVDAYNAAARGWIGTPSDFAAACVRIEALADVAPGSPEAGEREGLRMAVETYEITRVERLPDRTALQRLFERTNGFG